MSASTKIKLRSKTDSMKCKSILLLLVISTSSLLNAFAEDSKMLFEKGNSYYKAKQYQEANYFYHSILQKDKNNINAAYNLGNSYYHLNKYPEAVLYYEKALKHEPDNKQILQNLTLCNNKLFSKMDFSKEFFVTKYSKNFLYSKSSSTWKLWMLVFLWVGAILIMLFFLKANQGYKKTGIVLLIVSVIFGYLSYSKADIESHSTHGIVFGENTTLLKSPVETAKILDSIPAGTKVKFIDEDAGWIKAELPNGKEGWIKNSRIESI